MSDNSSELIQFLGRLHPMLVHLPIGFLVLLAILEVLASFPRFRPVGAANRVILVLILPVTLAGAGCGWLLSWGGDYDARILAWHKWTGTSLAGAVLLLWLAHRRGWWRAYRLLLFAIIVLLAVTSHYGGSLTHGSDYLGVGPLRFLFGDGAADSGAYRPAGDVMAQPVYAAVIQPIFAENCVNCHGRYKSKGKLRLDSLEHLLKGGGSGPVIEPGDVAQSLLLERMRLPLGDDDHMPPEGKHQPSEDQFALLQWWVEAGSPTNQTVRELNPPEKIVRIFGLEKQASPGRPQTEPPSR